MDKDENLPSQCILFVTPFHAGFLLCEKNSQSTQWHFCCGLKLNLSQTGDISVVATVCIQSFMLHGSEVRILCTESHCSGQCMKKVTFFFFFTHKFLWVMVIGRIFCQFSIHFFILSEMENFQIMEPLDHGFYSMCCVVGHWSSNTIDLVCLVSIFPTMHYMESRQ